jgi:pimeloyl-ACP methyl ester carboxylesterase
MRIALAFLVLLAASFVQASPLARHGTLGIPLRQVPDDIRTKLKLGPQEALMVGSPANGLLANDIVVAVAGKRFKSFAEFNDFVRAETAQPKAKLTINRDGKEIEVGVTVQPRLVDNTDAYETLYDEVVSNGRRIRTFVTKPKSPGKHPVLFWIQGISTGSIDFPLSAKNYIAPVLKAFADEYVTVRVEKPGAGDSEGGPARLAGYNEETDIYRQALKSLDKYDFVDRSNVFVFGHSMGGCHAPLICSEIPVRGIITYGTVTNSWLEWEIRNPRISEPLAGKTSAQVDQDVRQVTQFYNYIYNEHRTIAWIKKNHPELDATTKDQSVDGIMLGDRTVTYMQEVNDKNFCDAWSKVGDAHVLALFGENDWISLKEDQVQVADTVNATKPGHAEFKVVPGSDHIFSKCTSMKDSFDHFAKPGSEVNPEVIKTMRDWMTAHRG